MHSCNLQQYSHSDSNQHRWWIIQYQLLQWCHHPVGVIFFGVRVRLGTILGRFSIIYVRGLGLRIRVWIWVRVWVMVRVRVMFRVRVRVSVVLRSGYVLG